MYNLSHLPHGERSASADFSGLCHAEVMLRRDEGGHGLVVKCDLAKVESGVRFSLPA